VIDTSNYIPARDGKIENIGAGQVESLWSSSNWDVLLPKPGTRFLPILLLRRPNLPEIQTLLQSLSQWTGITLRLVDETGFDAFDAGALADSWRHQPAAPAYCTDLTLPELQAVIDTAEMERLPKRRALAYAVLTERMGGVYPDNIDWEFVLRVSRTLYI
jgi:8-hydroxy-5-deazaflavin:NADPH oxidoreductase